MARRRKLRQHLRKLGEIRDIMEAMKNLAVLETHKLGAVLANQTLLRAELERIAADFLAAYPQYLPRENGYREIWLLFGSERGFCGDFNETVLNKLDGPGAGAAAPLLIPVGRKLCTRLEGDPRVYAAVDGADVAEETASVLNSLIRHIGDLQDRYRRINVFALYRHADTDAIVSARLLPFFPREDAPAARYAHAPLLNLPPETFYLDLVDRYLFIALQQIASTSLMAESYRRIQHMSGAIRRLEETEETLLRKYHTQRQEEITEEIEVILLNATTDA